MVITANIFFQSPKTNLWKTEKLYILLHLAEYGSNIKENIKTPYYLFKMCSVL